MTLHLDQGAGVHPRCCESCGRVSALSRRDFLMASGIGLSTLAMGGVAWGALAGQVQVGEAPGRAALVVKPVLLYSTPQRRPQTSWRSWGGIQTQEDADQEAARIKGELEKIQQGADYPVKMLPVSMIKSAGELGRIEDLSQADTIVLYAAGGPQDVFDAVVKTGKNVVFFLRHRSGPVYLWYEIISPRYLHQHTDTLAVQGVDNGDVVVDSLEEVNWRLRSLCGLKNSLNAKIVAIGGASGWETPKAPDLARQHWKLEIQNVSYPELTPIIEAAMKDAAAVKLAQERAAAYLNDPGVKLETEKSYVENAFLLDGVFRGLMQKAGARMMTINACMGAIMPLSKTTACLTLSTLNDDGYLAFCESDFVVIPSGILLANIAGRPQFLNDPTYPHDGVITLAHCTAPRKMDGKTAEPVRLLTHFESDYGAAPKVEMRKGQVVTNVIPDFAAKRYVGLRGEIVDAPFLPICRSQIDVAYKAPDKKVALNMPGFHWETMYGDYLKEMGYALKKVGIGWEVLG